MKEVEIYKSLPLQKIKIEDVAIGLRQVGKGHDLIFIHGFPTHGYTWRKQIPLLSQKFRCTLLDLPGLGDSEWSEKTDFTSTAQARYILQLLEQQGIKEYSLIAHNSGATVARVMAIEQAEKVKNLILINTEIPHHRPPWIPFYQQIGLLPLVPSTIQKLLQQKWFVQSPMGFKEAYSDKSLLGKKENLEPYLNPVTTSHHKAVGAFKYLKGIDWQVVDDFEKNHQKIKAAILLIWGEDDKTFPIELAKKMTPQFSSRYEFKTIKKASLLPHEEKPEEVNNAILEFMETYF